MRWSVPKSWPGATVAILGGGPSLTPQQVDEAKRFRRIATNNAFTLDPEAEVTCWGDAYWLIENHGPLQWFKGLKVTWRQGPEYRGLEVRNLMPAKSPPALAKSPCCIAGKHTGHGAINLAVHFGAARILLLGFDMTAKRGDNWHTFHKRHASEERFQRIFIPEMEALAKEAVVLGVEILNCTPGSALKCFPFADVKEIQ